MPSRIVIFGATGYTGRLTAERLVAQGAEPVLAGRSEQKLRSLSERLGGLPWEVADVERAGSVAGLVERGDVLVSTVGPFVRWGEPAVRAAVAAAAIYLDSTGEPPFIRRVFSELGAPARSSGATLLPAMGYDFVPGTLAEIALSPSFAFRGGTVRTVRSAERLRSFPVKGRQRPAISVGGVEHFAVPPLFEHLREVNVYLGWFGPLARGIQATSRATALAGRVPGLRHALVLGAGKLAGMGDAPAEGTTPGGLSWIAATAHDDAGKQLAEVHLSGADGYDFTAGMLTWAARRAASEGVAVTGAAGPLEAFGLEALEQGCAEAGIARVS